MNLAIRYINETEYPLILELDKKLYPSSEAVTVQSMRIWYQNNPEFGLIFTDGPLVAGALACIPLKKSSWIALIHGQLSESKLTQEDIFDIHRDREIAIHIYHIEKLTNVIKNFSLVALTQLNKQMRRLRLFNNTLEISGYSAYCTTQQGIHLFSDQLAFTPSKCMSEEHIVRSHDGDLRIEKGTTNSVINNISTRDSYVCKCSMFVLTSHDKNGLFEL